MKHHFFSVSQHQPTDEKRFPQKTSLTLARTTTASVASKYFLEHVLLANRQLKQEKHVGADQDVL